MKKMMTKLLALALVIVLTCAALPAAFAAKVVSLNQTEFTFNVGLGTAFDDIGLPTVVNIDDGVTASIQWNKGNYNPNAEGTYTLTGTAMANGEYKLENPSVTATVTVTDVGFSLVLPEHIELRGQLIRGAPWGFKKLSIIRHVKDDALNDYQWTYRWYFATDRNGPWTFYGDTKDVDFAFSARQDYYYYCKVSATKNGVSKTLTSNVCWVELQENLFDFEFESSVDEIVPGEPFDLTFRINIMYFDGTVQAQYSSTVYPQTFDFTADSTAITFENNGESTMDGASTVKVIPDASLNADEVTITVHLTGQVSVNWYNGIPDFDLYFPLTLKVKGGTDSNATKTYSKTFTDVPTAWAAEAIDAMAEKGYMTGTSATTFSPSTSMTRAQLVTTLYRMAGSPEVKKAGTSFMDVGFGDYYYNAVAWASSEGIVNGMGDGRFAPNQTITRQDLAAVLYRYSGSPEVKKVNISKFLDAASVASYAEIPMTWATTQGLIKGTAVNLNSYNLKPNGSATRAQVALILYRMTEQ